MATKEKYSWTYVPFGGMTRVNITSGEDLRHLGELDQKLWTVLSCPVDGLEFDGRTLSMLDSDKDGKIRVNEVVSAASWLTKVIRDADLILEGRSDLPLEAFNLNDEEGKVLHDSARQILANLGKKDAQSISVSDTSDSVAIFASTRFNGDGIITAETPEDASLKALVSEIVATVGSAPDRSGAPGVDADRIEAFYAACSAYSDWCAAAEKAKDAIYPYGADTEEAYSACKALEDKIDDYFIRCRLADFWGASPEVLDVSADRIGAIAPKNLTGCMDEISSYPLSRVNGSERLSFEGINPAWKAAFDKFRKLVLDVEFPGADSISESQWKAVLAKFSDFVAWKGAKAGAEVESLGLDRLRAILREDRKADLLALVAEDRKLESEAAAIDKVDKLLHFYRDFAALLRNYVNFSDFYSSYRGETQAVFQCGQLYIEQRRLDLCIRVADMGKQGDMASKSGMFIIYCNCTSKVKGKSMTIAAILTDGDVDNIFVGQNAVFYDRDGLDWDAVVTKIVDNPVSIRQAFWSPYRKLGNTISDRIAKSAAEKDKKVSEGLTSKASTVTIPTTKEEKDAAAAAAPKAPFDIAKFAGIFAALGMALGMIGTAIMKIIDPWYNVLILFVVLVVCISGPSMFLAWLKLRKRNLAPVLNANGWAINSKVLVNAKFGATLTHLAKYPKLKLQDPFREEMSKGKKALIGIAAAIAVLAAIFLTLFFTDRLSRFGLPFHKGEAVVEQVVEAPAESVCEDAPAESQN